MELVLGVILAVLCLVGLCCGLCMMYARLLLPERAQGTSTVVWAAGAGEELELRVRSLMWLQECGLLRCHVVIANGGLNEEGRAVAERLVMRYPTLTLCNRSDLEKRLESIL